MMGMAPRLLLFFKLYEEVPWGCRATSLLIPVSTRVILLLIPLFTEVSRKTAIGGKKKTVYCFKNNTSLLISLLLFGLGFFWWWQVGMTVLESGYEAEVGNG